MKKSLALLAVLGVLQVACSTDAPKSQNTDTTKSSITQIKASNNIQQPQVNNNSRNTDYVQSPEFQEMVAKIKTRLQKSKQDCKKKKKKFLNNLHFWDYPNVLI